MRSLIVIGLLAIVASAKFGPQWHELETYTFDHYVSDYGLSYVRGTSEWELREKNFNTRLESIRTHNADSTKSWKRGVNQFSDWSEAEFKNYNKAMSDPKRASAKPEGLRTATVKSSGDLPRYVDYRTANPPVLTGIKNQAACGNCWVHGTVESIESHFAIKTGQLPVLSTQQPTSCSDADGCGGGWQSTVYDYVRGSTGLNEEWVYPFTDFFCDPPLSQNCTSKCRNISKMFTKQFKWWPKANVTQGVLVESNNALALMEVLAKVGPTSNAVDAGNDWSDYESGILFVNATQCNTDHIVQTVGYGYDFDLNMNYWIVRNSWGTNYGENGFIRLARPENETMCGTSALLSDPQYPEVAELAKKNDFYF